MSDLPSIVAVSLSADFCCRCGSTQPMALVVESGQKFIACVVCGRIQDFIFDEDEHE